VPAWLDVAPEATHDGALGFETYREGDGVICKAFKVG
jgi:hypothetical protein